MDVAEARLQVAGLALGDNGVHRAVLTILDRLDVLEAAELATVTSVEWGARWPGREDILVRPEHVARHLARRMGFELWACTVHTRRGEWTKIQPG